MYALYYKNINYLFLFLFIFMYFIICVENRKLYFNRYKNQNQAIANQLQENSQKICDIILSQQRRNSQSLEYNSLHSYSSRGKIEHLLLKRWISKFN